MRKLWGATALFLISTSVVYAQEAMVEKIHDTPAMKASTVANLLQEYNNPLTLYSCESNYLLYTYTSNINKQAISSYDWANNAKKSDPTSCSWAGAILSAATCVFISSCLATIANR